MGLKRHLYSAILRDRDLVLATAAILILGISGCTGVRAGTGVYRFQGKVLDAETAAPIKEARVVLDRYGSYRHVEGGRIHSNGVINEGVTDKQGDFRFDDYFPWESTTLFFPPLSFGTEIPKPDREVLVIFSEGHEPAFFTFRSGWWKNELIRMEWSDGILKEVERIKSDRFPNRDGYRFRFVRERLKTAASDRSYSGYLLDLPVVRLKRVQKRGAAPENRLVLKEVP